MNLVVLLAALAAPLIGVSPAPNPPALPSRLVLARYEAALDALPAPKAISFEYTIEQAGTLDIEQHHRVYRSGSRERDETLAVNDEKVTPPSVRIFRDRRDRYAVTNIAPRSSAYAFKYVGPHVIDKHIEYVFRTVQREPAPFDIVEVTIDGSRFLPAAVRFRTAQNGVRGDGAITYAPSGRYWLPTSASASVQSGSRLSRERILFTAYAFPLSLPDSTFGGARPLPPSAPLEEPLE